jgi:hypothetical protein
MTKLCLHILDDNGLCSITYKQYWGQSIKTDTSTYDLVPYLVDYIETSHVPLPSPNQSSLIDISIQL